MFRKWTHVPVLSGSEPTLAKWMPKIAQSTLSVFCVLALSSCGPVSSLWNSSDNAPQNQQNSAYNKPLESPYITQSSALTVPPDAALRPPLNGANHTSDQAPYNSPVSLDSTGSSGGSPPQSGAPPGGPPGGYPALDPPRGINTARQLFAAPLDDSEQRFQRLEKAVTQMREEFDEFLPAIVRLNHVEGDIRDLISQLEIMLDDVPPEPESSVFMPLTSPAPAASSSRAVDPTAPHTLYAAPTGIRPLAAHNFAPLPATTSPVVSATKAQKTPAATPDQNAATGLHVKALRIGEHKDKTRLVLDLTGSAQYRTDLDNSENILVIELPDAEWDGRTSWSSSKAPLIKSYNVQPIENGKGHRVVMLLKHPASIGKTMLLKPNGSANYRIVIDLTSPVVHE